MLGSAMLDADHLPSWMDKADVGAVAVLTLDNGECLTAEVRDFNDDRDELIVDVVSANRTHPNNSQRSRAIPIRHIVSFEPRPRAEQQWPYSDPCRGTSFSFARFVLMATLFLCMTVGSLPLFFLLMKGPLDSKRHRQSSTRSSRCSSHLPVPEPEPEKTSRLTCSPVLPSSPSFLVCSGATSAFSLPSSHSKP